MKLILVLISIIIFILSLFICHCNEGEENLNRWNRLINNDTSSGSSESVSEPSFDQVTGIEYPSGLKVNISITSPVGATVIYTTDDSYPSADANCNPTNGTVGTTVTLTSTGYLRAIGCMPNYLTSSVASRKYNIVKKVFVSTQSVQGDFGGVNQADAVCLADRPDALDYKALIVDNATRIAKPGSQTGWILLANTKYYRQDGITAVFTTNNNGVFDYSGSMNNSFAGSGDTYWTGLNIYWESATENCSNWTDITLDGVYGLDNQIDGQAIAATTSVCTDTRKILCIEQ